MAVISARVNCFRCGKAVDKTQTILLEKVSGKNYECFTCYKRNKGMAWGFGDKVKVKQELYCQRCKYKFKSAGGMCPYCNKDDITISQNIKIEDLL